MNQSTPTMGPWKISKKPHFIPWLEVEDNKGHILAVIQGESRNVKQHITETLPVEANARLIASAPELLKACKVVELYLQGNTPGLAKEFGRKMLECDIVAIVQKAIVKAEKRPGGHV